MRIALISTLARTVPPAGEGSVETLVSLLAEGLVERGHDVTLYAAEGSRTSARLRTPCGESYSTASDKWDWQLYEAWNTREAFAAWREFDVIHCHSYHHGLLFCDSVPVPSLHTFHLEPGPDLAFLAERTGNRQLVFGSEYQSRNFAGIAGQHVIPHGIEMPDAGEADGTEASPPLVWLGRFQAEKGPDTAVRIARELNMPLHLAGPANEYFEQVIRPQLAPGIVAAGEVSGAGKTRFLKNARALLYPLRRPEPFGLVVIEALLCGTPVIAFREGAVAEIVEHGRTGFLCRTEEEMRDAAQRAGELDREVIRAEAKRRFSATRMIDDYERLMLQVTEETAHA